MVSAATPTMSPPTRGVLSPGAAIQLSALPSNGPDCPPYLPTQIAPSSWQAPRPLIQLAAEAVAPRGENLERQAYEPYNAYLVDLAPEEEEGADKEAQEEEMLEDLELLFQEQLAVFAEDAAELDTARKGKAVITDQVPAHPPRQQDHSSIMVLEETVIPPPTRPFELITS